MDAQLKWYDSAWLNKYLAAKDVIARVAPSRSEEFINSFRVLRTDPAFIVKDATSIFDTDTLGKDKGHHPVHSQDRPATIS